MDFQQISKNQLKFVYSLKLKKSRQKYNKILVEGHKIVTELLTEQKKSIDFIIAEEDWLVNNQKEEGIFFKASQKQLQKVTQLKTAPPVMAIVSIHNYGKHSLESLQGKFLYLDQINDPGNAGTIIRIADWFGFDGVLFSHGSVDVWNPKCVQASMGSIFRVNFIENVNFLELSSHYNGKIIATTLDGTPANEYVFDENSIICFGSESHGLQEEIIDNCHANITIDPTLSKGAESLNIGVSAGIVMYLATR